MELRSQRNVAVLLNVFLIAVCLHLSAVEDYRQHPPPTVLLHPPSSAAGSNDAQQSSDVASVCVPQIELMGPGAKLSKRFKQEKRPTFEDGLQIIHTGHGVYDEWRNCAGKKPSNAYTHTNINQSFADWIVREVQPKFMLEVGSFTGLSSVRFGQAIVNNGLRGKTWLLCIDTWLGDLRMWLDKPAFAASLSWRGGEPEVYDQWMIHVVTAKLTDVILPMRQTSILGARFLKAVKWQADFIYLDSAHEVDETFNELVLYWDRLAENGILMGDDYVWRAVRHDVMKFVTLFKLTLHRPAELLWYIRKPVGWTWPDRKLFRRSLGYYHENENVLFDPVKIARYRKTWEAEAHEAD